MAAPGWSEEVSVSEPPAVVVLGDVSFQHWLHADDLGIECTACHHETDAAALDVPHTEYFSDFWIDCEICHRPDAAPTRPQACSNCHHSSPVDIADETLSSKVVIHRRCWDCHETGTGSAASASCPACHAGANPAASASRDSKE
jgi:hypothetical protein